MHLDFASEYARRSDEEIRLLIADRQNLVDEARDALDAEVRKRHRNGFQIHVREPEEPRVMSRRTMMMKMPSSFIHGS